MARSATFDKSRGQWRGRIDGYRGERTLFLRLEREQFGADDREAVFAQLDDWSGELTRLARRPTVTQANRLHGLGLLNEEELGEILDALGRPMTGAEGSAGRRKSSPNRPSIEAAYQRHPSTMREAQKDLDSAMRYKKALQRFLDYSGLFFLDELTFDALFEYNQNNQDAGVPWDTRRHWLMPVRRAAQMAPDYGIPDPIGRRQLNRKTVDEQVIEVDHWSADVLRSVLMCQEDLRWRVAIGLAGFCGMRTSEVIRARCGDVDPSFRLSIGLGRDKAGDVRKAKTKFARRIIPLPPTLGKWALEVAAGRDPHEPLIDRQAARPKKGARRIIHQEFNSGSFAKWLRRDSVAVKDATWSDNVLRRSFANLAIEHGAGIFEVETYYGHRISEASAVATDHYLQLANSSRLQVVADVMEKLLIKDD